MYRAFNVKLDGFDWQQFSKHYNYNYNCLNLRCRDDLRKLINSSHEISANKIKQLITPVSNYDIFISHSHKDINLAKGLAGYLEEYCKVSCFIDSLYWGNIDELLEEFNKKSLHEDKATGKEYFDHQSTLTPVSNYDIFISHSHKDINLAKGLAGYLEEYCKVSCFIDSLYWGNIDELLEEFNKKSLHEDKATGKEYFDHQSTKEVAKHANMILASALTEMINNSECVFFLNTDNSVISGSDVINKNETSSPWIYHEIFITSIIYRRETRRYALFKGQQIECNLIKRLPRFIYSLDLTGMTNLNDNDILNWGSKLNSNNAHPLDVLYKLKPEQNRN